MAKIDPAKGRTTWNSNLKTEDEIRKACKDKFGKNHSEQEIEDEVQRVLKAKKAKSTKTKPSKTIPAADGLTEEILLDENSYDEFAVDTLEQAVEVIKGVIGNKKNAEKAYKVWCAEATKTAEKLGVTVNAMLKMANDCRAGEDLVGDAAE